MRNLILVILVAILFVGCNEGGSGGGGGSSSAPSAPVATPTPTRTPTPTPTPTPACNGVPTLTASGSDVAEASAASINLVGADPCGKTLTYACAASCPAGLSVDPSSGVVTWTPNYGEAGSKSIIFSASNGTSTAISTATFTVSHTNRAPVFNALSGATIAENQTLIITPVANDPDGDPVTITLTGSQPANSVFANGSVTFTPSYAQQGSFTFHFRASDGSLTTDTSMSVSVSKVNQSPVLSIGAKSGSQNNLISFNLGGTDPNGDTLTYTADNLPAGATLDASSGAFSWTPACVTQQGVFNVTFHASDGSLTATEIVPITVAHTNCYAPTWQGTNYFATSTANSIHTGPTVHANMTNLSTDADNSNIWTQLNFGFTGVQYKCFNVSTSLTASYDSSTKIITYTNAGSDESNHALLIYSEDSDGQRIYKWVRLRYTVNSDTYVYAALDQGTTYSTPDAAWLCPSGSPILVQ